MVTRRISAKSKASIVRKFCALFAPGIPSSRSTGIPFPKRSRELVLSGFADSTSRCDASQPCWRGTFSVASRNDSEVPKTLRMVPLVRNAVDETLRAFAATSPHLLANVGKTPISPYGSMGLSVSRWGQVDWDYVRDLDWRIFLPPESAIFPASSQNWSRS